MLNAHDAFAVKFALYSKDISVTCACMKGAGFKISRLAIDEVQLTMKYAVARCGTSVYKAV